MAEMNIDMLLGSAIQLIKDIRQISFLGGEMECLKVRHLADDWLKQLEIPKDGATNG